MTKKAKAGYHLPAELVKQVKMTAIEQGCRDSHIVEAALKQYLGGDSMTWNDLNEKQTAELVDTLRFGDDIARIAEDEKQGDSEPWKEALWTYIDRNPYREKEVNEFAQALFG